MDEKTKVDQTAERLIDLSISWKQALPYLLILIDSHSRKSYVDSGSDKAIRESLEELVEQHETLSKFYTDSLPKEETKEESKEESKVQKAIPNSDIREVLHPVPNTDEVTI